MNKIFKKLLIGVIASLSLTSCMDLLPTPSRRSKRPSSDDEISESRNNISDNELSTRHYDDPYDCSVYAPSFVDNAIVGELVTIRFYLLDNQNNEVEITDESKVNIATGKLDYSFRVTKYYLEMDLCSQYTGKHSYGITLVSTKGKSYSQYYKLYVYEAEQMIDIQRDDNIEIPLYGEFFAHCWIYNRHTGESIRFNPSYPCEIDASHAPSVTVESVDVFDNNTTLEIKLRGNNTTTPEGEYLLVKLFDYDGNTYDTQMRYVVKPNYYVQVDDTPIYVDYGETKTVTLRLIDENQRTVNMSKEGYDFMSYGMFEITLDYIDNSKMKIRITNANNVDNGNIRIRIKSLEGFTYEGWFEVTTSTYYENYYWLQLDGEDISYNKDSYVRFILYNRYGQNKLIKDLSITSNNGIIPSADIKDINAYTYEYRFVPKRHGTEHWRAKVTCYDDSTYEVEFETVI